MKKPIRERNEPRPDLELVAVFHSPDYALYAYELDDEYVIYNDEGEELLGPETSGEASWNDVATCFCENAGDM